MQNEQPETVLCACGREPSAASVTTYTSPSGSYRFHRCPCGLEWTERLEGFDRGAPVSHDEVLDVHERLARFEGGLNELLGVPRG